MTILLEPSRDYECTKKLWEKLIRIFITYTCRHRTGLRRQITSAENTNICALSTRIPRHFIYHTDYENTHMLLGQTHTWQVSHTPFYFWRKKIHLLLGTRRQSHYTHAINYRLCSFIHFFSPRSGKACIQYLCLPRPEVKEGF